MKPFPQIACWLLALAGTVGAQNPNSAVYPARPATDADLLVASNGAQSTLNAAITSGATNVLLAYLSGIFDFWAGSGNITYTSTVAGACSTGSSSFDVHAALERLQ